MATPRALGANTRRWKRYVGPPPLTFQCKKEAITDSIKRGLKTFGRLLGYVCVTNAETVCTTGNMRVKCSVCPSLRYVAL